MVTETRSSFGGDAIGIRTDAGDGEGRTLCGHFAVFDTWTKIDNVREGLFLERVAPGTFAASFAKPAGIRVLFHHGQDPSIGIKPIAVPTVLREDSIGAYYEAEMFDASYANDLIPALRAGQLGASFKFSITEQDWNDSPQRSAHNPDRISERTIRAVNLIELGPCTWGQYPSATAGIKGTSTPAFKALMLT
jgi:HK97 family phage prohead protease